jgi:hypothetical protein
LPLLSRHVRQEVVAGHARPPSRLGLIGPLKDSAGADLGRRRGAARGKRKDDDADAPPRQHARADKQADPDLIYAAMAVIPNDETVDWNGWNDLGMACYLATDGCERGFDAAAAAFQNAAISTSDRTRSRDGGGQADVGTVVADLGPPRDRQSRRGGIQSAAAVAAPRRTARWR